MFGLSFLFGAALLALPLAGLPILLHMLFRRRSPILLFSTLRFIKASLQQTAARRRIQRWILLACRVLLLALLIWAVAQPQRTPKGASSADGGRPTLAAIVVDTSYSMLLKEDQLTLLDKANEIVGDLLREPLSQARVVIYRSMPSAEEGQAPPSAAELVKNWGGLSAQPSPQPLSQRAADAMEFLSRQPDQHKWLVVISDLQSRKFSTPLPEAKGVRTVLFDLHPAKGVSHGVTRLAVRPQQPLPGSIPDLSFEVFGRAGGEPRFGSFHMTRLDGTDAAPPLHNLKASFTGGNKARVQVPGDRPLPAERWLLLKASLDGEDDMAWDNERSYLLEVPLKQPVTFIDAASPVEASRAVWAVLSLHQENAQTPWLLEARRGSDLSGREQAEVLLVTEWPDAARAQKLRDFASRGGNVVLLLQPGLEQAWEKLPAETKAALLEILPGEVQPTLSGGGAAGRGLFVPVPPPEKPDPLIEDMLESLRREPPTVRRFVPFAPSADPGVSTLLYLAAKGEDARSAQFGLWYRRSLGGGAVFTFTSLPEERYMTPGVPWTYPMQLVKSCMRVPNQGDAQNVEVGQPISFSLSAHQIEQPAGIRLVAPPRRDRGEQSGPEAYEFSPDRPEPFVHDAAAGRLTYPNTQEPGLYQWYLPGQAAPVAVSNVQYPAGDCELAYREADTIAPADAGWLTVRREGQEPYLEKLDAEMKKVTEPTRIWTWFIAIVVILICLEAMLASLSNLWKPLAMKWLKRDPAPAEQATP